MFDWFRTRECKQFGQELAADLLATLGRKTGMKEAKFKALVEGELVRTDTRVQEFRRTHRLNFYKKSVLANTFLWKLKDAGISEDYAGELTHWLSVRL